MMILYNKYRPRKLNNVQQDFTCRVLQKQLDNNSIGNCYIFHGPPGTGKTSIARILAAELLEDDSDLIFQGKHPDLYEINCSENNGVDHARELIIDRAKNSPTQSKYKIFILDEAQGITVQGQRALLKIFEEPPKHVKFFLCTTEINKIIEAIQSRAQIFNLKSVPAEQMLSVLKSICDQEEIEYEEEALDTIVRFSNGSLRTAISALQQLSDIGLDVKNVTEFYQTSSFKDSIDIIKLLVNKDNKGLFLKIKKLADDNTNLYDLILNINKILMDLIDLKIANNKNKNQYILDLDPIITGSQILKIAGVTKDCLKESKQSLPLDFILQTQFLLLITKL